MTRDGFRRLAEYLGVRYGQMEDSHRRALWEDLSDQADAAMLQAAKAYTRSPQARYGLPRAGQLIELAASEPRRSDARPTPEALIARVVGAETSRAMESGRPFMLMPMTGHHGGRLMGQDGAVMTAMPFGAGMRERYRRVCTRGEEWVTSFPARGPVPPCVACHDADLRIENCSLDTIRGCATKILGAAIGREALSEQETP